MRNELVGVFFLFVLNKEPLNGFLLLFSLHIFFWKVPTADSQLLG